MDSKNATDPAIPSQGGQLQPATHNTFLEVELHVPTSAGKDAGGVVIIDIKSAASGARFTQVTRSLALDAWAPKNPGIVGGTTDTFFVPVPAAHTAEFSAYGDVQVTRFKYRNWN